MRFFYSRAGSSLKRLVYKKKKTLFPRTLQHSGMEEVIKITIKVTLMTFSFLKP